MRSISAGVANLCSCQIYYNRGLQRIIKTNRGKPSHFQVSALLSRAESTSFEFKKICLVSVRPRIFQLRYGWRRAPEICFNPFRFGQKHSEETDTISVYCPLAMNIEQWHIRSCSDVKEKRTSTVLISNYWGCRGRRWDVIDRSKAVKK